jgi:hypothetical protein
MEGCMCAVLVKGKRVGEWGVGDIARYLNMVEISLLFRGNESIGFWCSCDWAVKWYARDYVMQHILRLLIVPLKYNTNRFGRVIELFQCI